MSDLLAAVRSQETLSGVRHCVMLRFRDDVDKAAVVAEINKAIADLPEKIPEILQYSYGGDLGAADGNHDFICVADFADVEGYKTYATHPAHVEFVTNIVKPVLAPGGRTAVQYAL